MSGQVFVISFDLIVELANHNHPKRSRQAYLDIEIALRKHGFERVQWSVYAAKDDDLASLVRAIMELKKFRWFGPSVKNIRAFRMEPGTDLTSIYTDPKT